MRLDAALLRGQEQAANGLGEMEILDVLFSEMGWNHALKQQLAREVFDHYTPAVFDDTLPFLRRMGGICVLSNNNHAPEIAAYLGMTPYIKEFFTPKLASVPRGKPHRDLWDAVSATREVTSAALIGDDPWSDGAFADTCGIDCYLLDRLGRFGTLTQYRRITSLAAIPSASADAAPG
jgi:FMN phosphatase YigB (HAD superfamily)